MSRILIIGTSCAGKSTLARKLSEILKIPHVELDELQWLPGWNNRSDDEFRDKVTEAAAKPAWIMDGNYSLARDIHWAKAEKVIWLNYSFSVVLFRAFKRSISRMITKKKVCNGNVETFRQTFLSKESILLWVIKTHRKRKNEYRGILEKYCKNAEIIELNKPSEAVEFLGSVKLTWRPVNV